MKYFSPCFLRFDLVAESAELARFIMSNTSGVTPIFFKYDSLTMICFTHNDIFDFWRLGLWAHKKHWTQHALAGHNMHWEQNVLDTKCIWAQNVMDTKCMYWAQHAFGTTCIGHIMYWAQHALDTRNVTNRRDKFCLFLFLPSSSYLLLHRSTLLLVCSNVTL